MVSLPCLGLFCLSPRVPGEIRVCGRVQESVPISHVQESVPISQPPSPQLPLPDAPPPPLSPSLRRGGLVDNGGGRLVMLGSFRRHPVPWLLVIGSVLLVGGFWHVRSRTGASRLPERGVHSATVKGLGGAVRVRVDRAGVPHVEASSVRDAWFAEGYLHARERFFSMELSRRAAAGRLSELLGEATLTKDRHLRTWRLAETARRQVGMLSAEELAALEAYADGVNAALTEWGRWIAPELVLLGADPEPWSVEDTLGIGLLFELGVSQAMGEEMDRAVELEALGRRKAVDLWGWTASEARRWIPPDAGVGPRSEDDAILPGFSGIGSNNWALAGSRTASGRPLVANDPHLGINMPSPWYPIHLRAPGLDVAGVSLPGAPGVLIGHTEGVAWAFTMTMLDDQDLFRVTLDPSGRKERWRGAWRPLRVVEETIPVLGWREPARIEVLISRHGPLVRRRGRHGLALAWTALRNPSPLGAFLRMDRSSTVREVESAWEGVAGPGMNLVAADTRGDILHRVVGLPPVRTRGAGRLPVPGDDPSWSWRGLASFSRNPRTFDPASGFVATANHDLFAEGDFPTRLWFPAEFDQPWRIRRIRERLKARDDWTVAGCLDLQSDVVSLRARTVLYLLEPDLREHGGWTASVLLGWDGTVRADEPGPFVLSRLMLALEEAAGGDEARRGGLDRSVIGDRELVRLLAGAMDPSWWDDVSTPERETRKVIVGRVLDRLDREHDGRPWGAVHTVWFRHPLGHIPVVGPWLDRLLSVGPFPAGGDGSTIDRAGWLHRRPFAVAVIPSMRFVADVGDWDRSVLVVPPGASGRPWSSHYDDQVAAWLEGRGVPLPFTETAVAGATAAILDLRPAAGQAPSIGRPRSRRSRGTSSSAAARPRASSSGTSSKSQPR